MRNWFLKWIIELTINFYHDKVLFFVIFEFRIYEEISKSYSSSFSSKYSRLLLKLFIMNLRWGNENEEFVLFFFWAYVAESLLHYRNINSASGTKTLNTICWLHFHDRLQKYACFKSKKFFSHVRHNVLKKDSQISTSSEVKMKKN